METDRVTQRQKLWVPLWALFCALVSVPAALVLETVTGFNSPGAQLMTYLLHPSGLGDFGKSLSTMVALDSVFCFAVLAGASWLVFTQFAKRKLLWRKNNPN